MTKRPPADGILKIVHLVLLHLLGILTVEASRAAQLVCVERRVGYFRRPNHSYSWTTSVGDVREEGTSSDFRGTTESQSSTDIWENGLVGVENARPPQNSNAFVST